MTAVVSVQYQIVTAKTYDAYYRLTDPTAQIRSYVYDVVRSEFFFSSNTRKNKRKRDTEK